MAHSVSWPKPFRFFAMGNTPAVCLTSELPPDQSADILLLGCDNVKSILYTVYADLGAPSRPLDFTCCDIDPAILARHILIYTLLDNLPSEGSDEYLQRIWNIYYHFFVDEETLDMVLKQCQVLIDLSPDIETWNGGKYGAFLRFSSVHSLSTIRKHWTFYIGTRKGEFSSLRAEFYNRKGGFGRNFGTWRSAGPLWMDLMLTGSEQFQHYWDTGVTFDEPDKVASATQMNPTFAHSVAGYAFPYGSDPLLSFHLAKSIAPIMGSGANKTVTVSSLVTGAVEEFKSWCIAFNKRIKGQASLVIRFLVGNAITVCAALKYCAINHSVDPGLYAEPWSSALLKLDGGDYEESASTRAPLLFDAIDASNLTEIIGLLNILIPCRPLMQPRSSSVMFTDTQVSNDDGIARDGFFDLLCGDLSVLSMILDLIPVSYISNFTSHCNSHEAGLLAADERERSLHKHIAWRIGTLSDSTAIQESARLGEPLKFDEVQLANFFHTVYQNMFSSEDMSIMMLLQSRDISHRFNKKYSIVHYSRFTFAYVLRLMKDKLDVNWEIFINTLYGLISRDQKLRGSSHRVQDLFCCFHLLDMYNFLPDSSAGIKAGPLKRWKNVPPVVCITLRVPRKSFDILEARSASEIGLTTLQCSLMGTTAKSDSHNIFPYFQCFWGELKAEYSKDSSQEPMVTFDEDPEGFRGSSPAIFTFYVPASILEVDGPQKAILQLHPNPGTARIFYQRLGNLLALFSAELTDRRYVHITRERPGNPGELQKLRNTSFARHSEVAAEETPLLRDPVKVTLDSDCNQAALLTGRANIEDLNGRAFLADGATVSVNQVSPLVIQVTVGSHSQTIVYPFPVDSTNCKTRIARKSSYVEIDVKISGPSEKLGIKLPIIRQNKKLSLWNIHYLDLERVPALDLSSNRLSFLELHIRSSFSYRERQLLETENPIFLKGGLDLITRVKRNIRDLVVMSSGLKEERSSVLCLSNFRNDVYTLIFVNNVRLDLASHAVTIDACVLPLTNDVMSHLSNAIKGAAKGARLMQKPDEVRAWKHLLPAFTERCRKWSHTANCEYLSRGIPVSEEINQSPLCSCGQGKHLGSFTQNNNWKEFAPYVTRAAISPLFAGPFSDTIGPDIIDALRPSAPQVCARCHNPEPKLLVCGACKNTSYCSKACQKADWKVHKGVCKKV
ncbi:hypothetical protein F5887DRAFT_364133 [Amanita rubescens]|nr:hypothetical protein F5887DRAFT_364133 [Amanita rubescens]